MKAVFYEKKMCGTVLATHSARRLEAVQVQGSRFKGSVPNIPMNSCLLLNLMLRSAHMWKVNSWTPLFLII